MVTFRFFGEKRELLWKTPQQVKREPPAGNLGAARGLVFCVGTCGAEEWVHAVALNCAMLRLQMLLTGWWRTSRGFPFAEYWPSWVVFCWWKCCTLLVRFLWQQQHTTLASESRLTISKQGIQPWRHVCIWFISHISLFCTHSYLFWSNFHEYFKYFKILYKWVTCAFTFWHIFEGSCENEYSSKFGSEVSLRKTLIYIYIYTHTHTPPTSSFFIYWWILRFPVLSVVNNTAVNIDVIYVFELCLCFLWVDTRKWSCWVTWQADFSLSGGASASPPQWRLQLTFPRAGPRLPYSPRPCQHRLFVSLQLWSFGQGWGGISQTSSGEGSSLGSCVSFASPWLSRAFSPGPFLAACHLSPWHLPRNGNSGLPCVLSVFFGFRTRVSVESVPPDRPDRRPSFRLKFVLC